MKAGTDSTLKYHLIAVFFLCVTCIAIYSNTLRSHLVYDDLINISSNPYIRITDLNFKKLYNAGIKSNLFKRPVSNITFALNYFFGQYNVTGYHLFNIFIHLINGILVYFLSLITFKQSYAIQYRQDLPIQSVAAQLSSLFAALVFITHPIQTQSVAYITQRMNSIAAMFVFLALFLYIKGRMIQTKKMQALLFLGCVISWVMALGSKEIAATLPIIILLYEWFFFQDLRLSWLKQNYKLFLFLIVTLCLTGWLFLGTNPFDSILSYYRIRDFTLWERLLTQPRVIIFYISLLLFPYPSRLNLLHDISTSTSLFVPMTTILSFIFIIGLIGLAIYPGKNHRLLSFCIFWFFINLAIESSIIGLEMIYEHRLYLPMFGFSLVMGHLFYHMVLKKPWITVGISLGIILFLSTGTYVRNRVWQDSITLWTSVVSQNDRSYIGHNNLGIELAKQGRIDEAIVHYKKALKIKPDYAEALNNMGIVLFRKRNITGAVEHFKEALRIKRRYANPHNNWGLVLAMQGRNDEAIKQYLKALRIRPNYADAHYNLGNALLVQGKIDEAIVHYLKTVSIDPGYVGAHNNMGVALFRKGNLSEAIDHFHEALRIKPDYVDAKNNLKKVSQGQRLQ